MLHFCTKKLKPNGIECLPKFLCEINVYEVTSLQTLIKRKQWNQEVKKNPEKRRFDIVLEDEKSKLTEIANRKAEHTNRASQERKVPNLYVFINEDLP